MSQIFAVIVTHEPDPALLAGLLQALAPQVMGGIVVNNGRSLPLSDMAMQQAGFAVRHLQTNAGVATALNIGFEWARAQKADFVITFDQDSSPAPDMVARLLGACQNLSATGQKVGAVGPQQVDRRTGRRAAFIAPVTWRRDRVAPDEGQTVEVDHLITSGCLVPMAAWTSAGAFLDELFIDYVDIEWSLRLRHRGWHLYGVGGARLMHSMGDDIKHWCGWQIPWHDPLRHYFMLRNGIHLQKLPHISFGWKFADAVQLVKRFVFCTLVGRPRADHLRAMLRGMRDGWHGRLGSPTRPAPDCVLAQYENSRQENDC